MYRLFHLRTSDGFHSGSWYVLMVSLCRGRGFVSRTLMVWYTVLCTYSCAFSFIYFTSFPSHHSVSCFFKFSCLFLFHIFLVLVSFHRPFFNLSGCSCAVSSTYFIAFPSHHFVVSHFCPVFFHFSIQYLSCILLLSSLSSFSLLSLISLFLLVPRRLFPLSSIFLFPFFRQTANYSSTVV